jgi:hypothetical protein
VNRPSGLQQAPGQTPEQIAAVLEAFLTDAPHAVVMEDGKVLFDLREAKYSLAADHGRCTLHLWGANGNLVRRIVTAQVRGAGKDKLLKLSTLRFGQTRPQILEIAGDKDRRTPSARETTRVRFVRTLARVLERQFPDWHPDALRTAMDLEKSFGPAYARGLLVQGRRGSQPGKKAWAVIAVNDEESSATIDGILTFGVLWLEACREQAGGRRLLQGLMVLMPRGAGTLTLARMAWLAGDPDHWQLWEFDQRDRDETLIRRDPSDQGNLSTHLVQAPNPTAARERFAESRSRVLALLPAHAKPLVEERLRSATELAFLLYGLEFARIRFGSAADSFNRQEQISFGAGASETELNATNEAPLRDLVARLCERRSPHGDPRDPLYRLQPERWLEGEMRRDLTRIDRTLDPAHVYAQVPAFAGGDRRMLDLLGVTEDGRLAVIEIKAEEDPQLAFQGLDYWTRVRWHHAQNPDPATGLGEFQRHGYFGGVRLADTAPRLLLVAPALRIHPATEIVLRQLSPRVEWTLLALGERWRHEIKVVWRKRHNDA